MTVSTDILRTLSHSERDCWNDCRAKAHARYVLGHAPATGHPVRRLGALFEVAFAARLRAWCLSLGVQPWPVIRRDTLGRSYLDHEAGVETSPEGAIRAACKREQWSFHEKYGATEDAAELALALVGRAFEAMGFAGGRWRPVVINGWGCIQARLTAPLPVAPDSHAAHYYPGGVSGVLDFLGHDGERNWDRVLADTKVREKLDGDADIGADPQLALYQYLAAANGAPVRLCEQWEILGHVPEEPPANKDGKSISREATYRATRETFLAACHRRGISATGPTIEAHLAKLDARRWWQATPGGGTDAEVASLVRDFAADADLIAALSTVPAEGWPCGVPITRNLRTFGGAACQRCDLQTECHASHSAGLTLADSLTRGRAVPVDSDDPDNVPAPPRAPVEGTLAARPRATSFVVVDSLEDLDALDARPA